MSLLTKLLNAQEANQKTKKINEDLASSYINDVIFPKIKKAIDEGKFSVYLPLFLDKEKGTNYIFLTDSYKHLRDVNNPLGMSKDIEAVILKYLKDRGYTLSKEIRANVPMACRSAEFYHKYLKISWN